MKFDARRKRLIESRQAAKHGKRFYAFYRGFWDRKAGRKVNPFPAGSEDAGCWENGQKYVEDGQ